MVRATFAILAVLCFCGAAAGQAVNPPPQPLHKVDDHWTPYRAAHGVSARRPGVHHPEGRHALGARQEVPRQPLPVAAALGEEQVHPGRALDLPGRSSRHRREGRRGRGARGAPRTRGAAASARTRRRPQAPAKPGGEGVPANLVAVGSEDDIYCFAYLDDADAQPAADDHVGGADRVPEHLLDQRHRLPLRRRAEGVKAGQEYFVVLPVRKLRHPATDAVLGTVIRYLGHARVLCTQDHTATAEILASCDAIPIGAWLKPFEPIPIPMTVLTPPVDALRPSQHEAPGVHRLQPRTTTSAFGAGRGGDHRPR